MHSGKLTSFQLTLRIALATAIALFAGRAWPLGNPNEPYEFQIDAGEAAWRLNDFGTQSGMQLLFNFEDMKGVESHSVHGTMKPFDALDQMLRGTDIHYEFVNRRTITLTRTGSGQFWARRPKEGRDRPAKSSTQGPESTVDQVVVRSQMDNGIFDVTSIGITLNRTDLERLESPTIPGVLRTLPQIWGGGATEDTYRRYEAATNTAARGTGVNLRGLDAGSTLVLMNGHRLAGGGTEGLFVDVANLPLIAIERIEILPNSSSTAYGGDAVGGVVNFVMRRDFEGTRTEGHIGRAAGDTLTERSVSQLFGKRSARASALVAIDWYARDELRAADRQQAQSDLTALGGSNWDTVQSHPGNIVSGSTTWAIPHDQDGRSLRPADLVTGTANYQDQWQNADLLPAQERASIFSSLWFEANPRLTLFSDVLASLRTVRNTGPGQVATFMVPPSNAFYVRPTDLVGPVVMSYNFLDDLGSTDTRATVRTLNAVAGLTANLDSWKVISTLGYASEQMHSQLHNVADPDALAKALAEPDPRLAFNPFGDGSTNNSGVIDAIRTEASSATKATITSASLNVSGPLGQLPAGDIITRAGAGVRSQSLDSRTQATAASQSVERDRRQSIRSAFAELEVPLFDEANRLPLLHELRASVARRYEHYSDFGDAKTNRFGLLWQPSAGFSIRGSYSQSFRPPGLLDLDETVNSFGIVTLRNADTGASENVLVFGGKNRDLTQETARSWNLGVEYRPEHLPQSFVAVTYFDTKYVNRLSQLPFSAGLLNDPMYAGLITQDPSPQYRAALCSRAPITGSMSADTCLTAPIQAIADLRLHNDARLATRGFDILSRYALDTVLGKLDFMVNGTYILDFRQAQTPGSPMVELLNTATYPIDLRVRSSISWLRGPYELTSSVNYQDHYKDQLTGPARHVRSWTTFDLRAAYTFPSARGDSHNNATSVSLAVNNLLNTDPPFVNNPAGVGYDQENGDLTGRILSLNVRRTW